MKKRLFIIILLAIFLFSSVVLADESLPMEIHDEPTDDFYDTYAAEDIPSVSSMSGSSSYQQRRTVWVWNPETGEYDKVEETIIEEVTESESAGSVGLPTDDSSWTNFWSFFMTFFGGQSPATLEESIDGSEEIESDVDISGVQADEESVVEEETDEGIISESLVVENETVDNSQVIDSQVIEITPECVEEDGLVSGVMADGTAAENEMDLCYDFDDEGIVQVVDSCSGETCFLADVFCNEEGFVDLETYEGIECKDGAIYLGEDVPIAAELECFEEDGMVSGYDRDGYYEESLVDSCYDADQDYALVDSCSGGACMQVDFYCDDEGYLAYAVAEGVSCEGGIVIDDAVTVEEAAVAEVPAECVEEGGIVSGYFTDGEAYEGPDVCYEMDDEGNPEEVESCAGDNCMLVDIFCDAGYVNFETFEGVECSAGNPADEIVEVPPESSCYEEEGLVYGYYSDGEYADGESDQCFVETDDGNIDYTDSCAGEKCMYVDIYCNGDYVDFNLIQDTECSMGVSTGEGVYNIENVEGSTAVAGESSMVPQEKSGFFQKIFGWLKGLFSFLN